jgi:hypothetical protein
MGGRFQELGAFMGEMQISRKKKTQQENAL